MTTQKWLHKADPTYSRARLKKSAISFSCQKFLLKITALSLPGPSLQKQTSCPSYILHCFVVKLPSKGLDLLGQEHWPARFPLPNLPGKTLYRKRRPNKCCPSHGRNGSTQQTMVPTQTQTLHTSRSRLRAPCWNSSAFFLSWSRFVFLLSISCASQKERPPVNCDKKQLSMYQECSLVPQEKEANRKNWRPRFQQPIFGSTRTGIRRLQCPAWNRGICCSSQLMHCVWPIEERECLSLDQFHSAGQFSPPLRS